MTIELPPDRIIDPKEATRPGGRQQTPSKQMGHRSKGGWGGAGAAPPPDFGFSAVLALAGGTPAHPSGFTTGASAGGTWGGLSSWTANVWPGNEWHLYSKTYAPEVVFVPWYSGGDYFCTLQPGAVTKTAPSVTLAFPIYIELSAPWGSYDRGILDFHDGVAPTHPNLRKSSTNRYQACEYTSVVADLGPCTAGADQGAIWVLELRPTTTTIIKIQGGVSAASYTFTGQNNTGSGSNWRLGGRDGAPRTANMYASGMLGWSQVGLTAQQITDHCKTYAPSWWVT